MKKTFCHTFTFMIIIKSNFNKRYNIVFKTFLLLYKTPVSLFTPDIFISSAGRNEKKKFASKWFLQTVNGGVNRSHCWISVYVCVFASYLLVILLLRPFSLRYIRSILWGLFYIHMQSHVIQSCVCCFM